MGVKAAKGDRGRADILFSRIVRSRGVCERCGNPATDTAHIVKRRYSATRCIEDNAWALCRSCHRATEDDPVLFLELVEMTIGRPRLEELRSQAFAGPPKNSGLFWSGEVERLVERCRELGIDTRRRVPA